ncbi:MAG TPA: lysylphosphatidylglycerol synthase domain-containing protein [Acidimicrobiales bacterium]|nr:lysylphosphatidylglycerol synthase domain-containing protein [Acidimicrobiales bacterium]
MTAAGTGERPARSGWARVGRAAYLAVAAAALAWLGWDQRRELAVLVDDARPGLLVVALAVTGLQLWVAAAFWSAALAALGQSVPRAAVLDASARSLLARYLPGSLWYAVGRGALLRHQASRPALAVVATLEIGLSVVVGFVLGTGLLLATRQLAPGVGALGATGVVIAAAGCSPPVLNRALAWWARRRGAAAVRLGWRPYLGMVGWMALFWVVSAGSFTLYLHAFPASVGEAGNPPVLEVAGAFLVARVVGALALFAPQGLGVFEVTLATLLASSAAGPDPSLGGLVLVIAGYRALVLVRDGLAVTTAEALHSRRQDSPPP